MPVQSSEPDHPADKFRQQFSTGWAGLIVGLLTGAIVIGGECIQSYYAWKSGQHNGRSSEPVPIEKPDAPNDGERVASGGSWEWPVYRIAGWTVGVGLMYWYFGVHQRKRWQSAHDQAVAALNAKEDQRPWKDKYLKTYEELQSVTNRRERRAKLREDMLRRLRDWNYAWTKHREFVLAQLKQYEGEKPGFDLAKGAKLITGWRSVFTRFANEIPPYLHNPHLTDNVPQMSGDFNSPSLQALSDHEAALVRWTDRARQELETYPEVLRENFDGFKGEWSWPFPD